MTQHAEQRRGCNNASTSNGRSTRQAFTLIELLLALALSALVVTLAGRTAVQALTADRTVHAAILAQTRTEHVFATIRTDLNARIHTPVKLALDANHRPTIEITCLAPYHGDAIRLPRLPSTVLYRLVRSQGSPDNLRLERLVRDKTRANAPPISTTVTDELTTFNVSVFENNEWQALVGQSAARLRDPEAFRITYRFAGTDEATRRTFLLGQPRRDRNRKNDGR